MVSICKFLAAKKPRDSDEDTRYSRPQRATADCNAPQPTATRRGNPPARLFGTPTGRPGAVTSSWHFVSNGRLRGLRKVQSLLHISNPIRRAGASTRPRPRDQGCPPAMGWPACIPTRVDGWQSCARDAGGAGRQVTPASIRRPARPRDACCGSTDAAQGADPPSPWALPGREAPPQHPRCTGQQLPRRRRRRRQQQRQQQQAKLHACRAAGVASSAAAAGQESRHASCGGGWHQQVKHHCRKRPSPSPLHPGWWGLGPGRAGREVH